MKTFQSEQGIRTLVDEQLKNLGWNLTGGKERNVWQEQPRTKEEQKKLKRGRPDYVLYSKDSDIKEPLIIIEAKSPGKNLDEALKQGGEYAETLGAPIVFATDGIYYKTLHTKKHKPLFLNGEEVDELFRELEAIKFLNDNEVNTISEEVVYDRKQLIKIFEDSNDLLRDEGFRAGIERFGEFSNILFLKLIGELEDLKEEEGRNDEVVLDKYLRWSEWKNKTGKELLSFVNDTVLPKIGDVYNDDDIFTPLQIKNPGTLKKIIDKLDPLNLINIDSDIKGDSFEYFLKQSTATKNDLGEYFTPRHIVKVMIKLLNPQIGETVYDPFCGTGGTLIEAFKHISHNMASTPANWKQLRENTLFGNEITTTARITKMNMILIGDGHSGIQQKNSLKNPVEGDKKDEGYDIVVTNMPYSQKTEYGSYYDLPSTNGDSICIQHCIKAIDKASENGRMALVVPEGFLFRKDLQKTREYLLDRCTLKSVISLPQGVFLPYTGVKTNILYCTDVKKKKKQEKFWYFDVKNDGYSLDSHRRKLEGKTDLQKFLEYRNPENQNQKDILKIGFSQISMNDVINNDLVLVGSRYKKMFDYGSVEWEIVKIRDVAEIISGFAFKSSKFNQSQNGLPLIRIRDINSGVGDTYYDGEYNEKYLVNNGDFLIGMDGEFNAIIWNAGKALLNQRVCKLDNFKDCKKEYILYVIKKALKHIEDNTPQTTVKHISTKQILDIEIPLPPIEVQEEIVKELDGYQKVIDGARQIVKNYKPNIEIKDEWKSSKIGDIADVSRGGSPRPIQQYITKNEDGINWIKIGDVGENEKYITKTKQKIKTSGLSKTRQVSKGDLILSNSMSFGRPFILKIDGAIHDGWLLIKIKNNKIVLADFLYHILNSNLVKSQYDNLATGGVVKNLNSDLVRSVQIPLPPVEEQKKIVAQLEREESLISPNQEILEVFEEKIQDKLDFIWGK